MTSSKPSITSVSAVDKSLETFKELAEAQICDTFFGVHGVVSLNSEDDAEDVKRVIAAITAAAQKYADERVEAARTKDPLKCEFGHPVESHTTADGWCCACDADVAFMEGRLRKGASDG